MEPFFSGSPHIGQICFFMVLSPAVHPVFAPVLGGGVIHRVKTGGVHRPVLPIGQAVLVEGVAAGDVEGVVSVAVPAAQVVLVQLKAGPRQAGIGRNGGIARSAAASGLASMPGRRCGSRVSIRLPWFAGVGPVSVWQARIPENGLPPVQM